MNRPLMSHVVAGYPDADTCMLLLHGMFKAGVAAIEVQVPFSDPIADGETIMAANDVALENGMTTAGSFELIKNARKQGVGCDIYVMSYLQKARHFGIAAFCQEAARCEVQGLIIPDMPYDSPEYKELSRLAHNHKLELVPVLSPGMPKKRLDTLLRTEPARVYVTSQRGITGNAYSDTKELKRLIAVIRDQSGAIIMIGFGITTPQDVDDALKIGDMAVVGSAIIRQLESHGLEATLEYVRTLVGENL